jgi:hypothetical protein
LLPPLDVREKLGRVPPEVFEIVRPVEGREGVDGLIPKLGDVALMLTR